MRRERVPRHLERHRTGRIGWLRAAVLGANDGIVSTASLVVGVAAANATSHDVLVAGVAGLVAGAMSMAAGEYVSVSSQADTERPTSSASARSSRRTRSTSIGAGRDLRPSRTGPVARATGRRPAHGSRCAGRPCSDELGISDALSARPVQAALASAGTFAVGAAMPS